MSEATPITPEFAPDVLILKPTPGGSSLGIPNGTATDFFIEVEVVGSDPSDEVWAQVHLPFQPPVTNPPDTTKFTSLTRVGTTDIWNADVPAPSPGYVCNMFPSDAVNLQVTVVTKRGGVWKSPNSTLFKGVCDRQFFDAHAWCCPWFANAGAGLTGPEGEDVDTCRPVRVPVPHGAVKVDITAAGTWRHEQTTSGTSGPAGYGNPQPMVNPGYKHPVYNPPTSWPTPDPEVNSLVALLQPELGNATTILDIGESKSDLVLGTSRGIYFAMWDGRQWNRNFSNSGSVTVTLDWKRT